MYRFGKCSADEREWELSSTAAAQRNASHRTEVQIFVGAALPACGVHGSPTQPVWLAKGMPDIAQQQMHT